MPGAGYLAFWEMNAAIWGGNPLGDVAGDRPDRGPPNRLGSPTREGGGCGPGTLPRIRGALVIVDLCPAATAQHLALGPERASQSKPRSACEVFIRSPAP